MRKLLLEDFINYKFLSDLKFSPDGLNTAFIAHEMNLEENRYNSNIYTYNHNDNTILKLSSSNRDNLFLWKDSNSLFFSSLRSHQDRETIEKGERLTPIYEISLTGGEAKKIFDFPLRVNSMKLLDENTLILRALYEPEFAKLGDLSTKEKEERLRELKEEENYEIIDEIPFWSNGQGFTNKKRHRLYIYRIAEKSLMPITDEFTHVYGYELNSDGTKMVVITNSYIDKEQLGTDLQIYDFQEDKLVKISPRDSFRYSYANFMEDKIIFIGSDTLDYGLNQNPHFYLIDFEGYEMSQISREDFDFSTVNSIGSDCRYGNYETMKLEGDYLYFVTTEGDSSFINKIDSRGRMDKLSYKKGSIDSLDVFGDKIHFIGLRSLRLQEVYSLEDRKEIQLSHFNDWIMKERTLSIPEKLTFKTKEEVLIEGWVMKPVDFKPGKSFPAILNIHGGPKTAYGEVFFHEMQYWANEGYLVFFCNPRGSDGRGNFFADIRGSYGSIDFEDIMEFTDLVLEKYPFIDSKRIGLTGGSYGGFMTNWIIGHTSRFKAAVSQRSISNWISKFATTDIGYYFVDDQIKASPWTSVEKLWDHSPLKYADQVSTPTLFIHAEEDYRCWIPEAIQMFTALKYHGVESKLCMFRGENHELSRSGKPKNRIKRLEEISKWFDYYLK